VDIIKATERHCPEQVCPEKKYASAPALHDDVVSQTMGLWKQTWHLKKEGKHSQPSYTSHEETWKSHYHQYSGMVGKSSSVPEPTA
jgi:hypothetical protein